MSAQNHLALPGRAYPSKCPPQSDVTQSARSSQKGIALNQGSSSLHPLPLICVTSGGAAAILSVASGYRALEKCSSSWFTNSSVLPLRCGRRRRALPVDTAGPSHSTAAAVASAGASALSSFPATDRRLQGAAVSDVKRRKLPGHPALPDERVRAITRQAPRAMSSVKSARRPRYVVRDGTLYYQRRQRHH